MVEEERTGAIAMGGMKNWSIIDCDDNVSCGSDSISSAKFEYTYHMYMLFINLYL